MRESTTDSDASYQSSGPDIDSLMHALARAPNVARASNVARADLPTFSRDDELGHYRIIERLGYGSMGVVYLALDTTLGREVALKLVANATLADEDELRRVASEAQVLAALRHPNLVTVHSLETARGVIFISMDFVAGENLRKLLRSGPLEASLVLRGARELARGLAVAHASGIVHRDVKPENIRVDEHGNFVLVDFGLARFLTNHQTLSGTGSPDPADSTVATAVAGTPAYMAPGLQDGAPLDARADVWALGLVILEMATGSRKRGPRELARLPRRLRRVVRRCLIADPGQRAHDAGELLELLEPRGWKGVIAVASLTVLVGVGLGVRAKLNADPCAPPDDMIVEVWSADIREQIDVGFARSVSGYATDARAEVQALERYIADWTRQHRELCEAHVASGERFEASRQAQCLDRLLTRAGKLSQRFIRADAGTIATAATLIAELTPPQVCAELLPAKSSVQEPAQAQLFALEDRITGARQLGAGGDEAEAIAQIDATIADARALGDQAGVMRALLAKTSISSLFSDPTPGIDAAHEALEIALRLDDQEVIGDILLALLEVHTAQADYDKALILGELATHFIEAAGYSPQRIRASESLAELAIAREHWDEALDLLEPARARAVSLYGEDHLVVAELDQELAWANGASLRDLKAADRYYAHALAVYRVHYGDHHPLVGILYNDIGVLYFIRQEYALADDAHSRALAILREAFGPQHPESLTALANMASTAGMRGDTARAIDLSREVLEHRAALLGRDSPEYAASERDLSVVLQTAGRLEEARSLVLHYYTVMEQVHGESASVTVDAAARVVLYAVLREDVALQARFGAVLRAGFEHVPRDDPRFEYILGTLGTLASAENDDEAALRLSEQRLDWLAEYLGEDSPHWALAMSVVGDTLIELGHPDEARRRVLEAIEIAEGIPDLDSLDAQYLHRAVARADIALGAHAAARTRLLAQISLHERTPQQPWAHGELECILAEISDDPDERQRRAERAVALLETTDARPSVLARARALLESSEATGK